MAESKDQHSHKAMSSPGGPLGESSASSVGESKDGKADEVKVEVTVDRSENEVE